MTTIVNLGALGTEEESDLGQSLGNVELQLPMVGESELIKYDNGLVIQSDFGVSDLSGSE